MFLSYVFLKYFTFCQQFCMQDLNCLFSHLRQVGGFLFPPLTKLSATTVKHYNPPLFSPISTKNNGQNLLLNGDRKRTIITICNYVYLLTNTKYKYKCKNNVPMYKWGEGVKGLGRITISFEDIFFRKQLKINIITA